MNHRYISFIALLMSYTSADQTLMKFIRIQNRHEEVNDPSGQSFASKQTDRGQLQQANPENPFAPLQTESAVLVKRVADVIYGRFPATPRTLPPLSLSRLCHSTSTASPCNHQNGKEARDPPQVYNRLIYRPRITIPSLSSG